MANSKKTQAQRAASTTGGKKATDTSKEKSAAKSKGKATETKAAEERRIPIRFITAAVFLGLFLVFLVIFFGPQGALVQFVGGILYGLIGRFGFAVSIPVVLYLFTIHAFSGDRPVKMRTICAGVFVFLCGCLAHLTVAGDMFSSGLYLIGDLYTGGANGTTGGVLCGSVAMVLKWLCGPVISFILILVAAILNLLGSMQITVPGLIRAFRDRPRADWEDELPEKQEPAAVVVNHIAKKRIEYLENRRMKEAAQDEIPPHNPTPEDHKRAAQIMKEIKADIEAPVLPAADKDEPPVVAALPEPEKSDFEPERIPDQMPELKIEKLEEKPEKAPEVRTTKVTPKEKNIAAKQVAMEIAANEAAVQPTYCFPPIDLLKLPQNGSLDGTAEMRENSQRLNETLESFKIEAHIINVTRGPSVTRYEVELEKGVRLSKLTTAADDIALSLGATGVRIAAIPGKISVVGIEVPNKAVATVSLREVIGSNTFERAKSKSSFAVGKDIGGNCIVGNIAKLPHMLIAGTTGSGKSVCMNSIIISLLYKASPDDVKLIMVDPKMVELGIYNGIPHLLIPVVTDPKKAAGSLQWAVTEMMRRYKAMSDAGVRDLESYNSIVESQEDQGAKLPQVVVIIDELADLMLVAAKEVEESICRIAQMGRAAGIHLIIATQRPSADVITGLMKANIPSRIAFAVASAMESRIILDTQGAEKLVGKGDMLYAPIGDGKPKRVQGCYVSDGEVEAVATYVKSNFVTDYDQQVMEEIDRNAAQTGSKPTASEPEPSAEELEGDEMLPAAVDVILETGQASVSMLQRRLKLGYARAARIVDEMEEKGIVGPFQGSKPRTILITKEKWAAMRNGGGVQLEFEDLAQDSEEVEEEEAE